MTSPNKNQYVDRLQRTVRLLIIASVVLTVTFFAAGIFFNSTQRYLRTDLQNQLDSLTEAFSGAQQQMVWDTLDTADTSYFRVDCEYRVLVTDPGFAKGTHFMPTYVNQTKLVSRGQEGRLLEVKAGLKGLANYKNYEHDPITNQQTAVQVLCRCPRATK
ncbi:MAG TPA: hypothetical protein DCE41_25365 [Cytophagales bacterium]|nr:hypothetical protein [Cytophagales bacterium]HAA21992.1 hypothetical protein [Cytophagales bacterium]HAP61897.1 hypothetical protein [Cytophagales bacterium]